MFIFLNFIILSEVLIMDMIKNDLGIKKIGVLNATNIKIIAIILMFLDHIHQMFYWKGAPLWLKILGRPVFVMFLFLAAESFHYTKNRKKYLIRLLLASCIMLAGSKLLEIVFPNPNVVLMNNAFATFFVTVLYMQCWDWLVEGIKQKKIKTILKSIFVSILPILGSIPILLIGLLPTENIPVNVLRLIIFFVLFIPNILFVEGGYVFVIMGLLFYIFREKRLLQIIILFVITIIGAIYGGSDIQWAMCFGFIPMLLYNGERGKGMKNFFYVFYPVHIWILYIISTIFV